MIQTISDRTVRARKDYHCDSSEFLRECSHASFLTFAEKRKVINARQKGWKINKGDLYNYYVGKADGDLFVMRSILGISEICAKHELYPEY